MIILVLNAAAAAPRPGAAPRTNGPGAGATPAEASLAGAPGRPSPPGAEAGGARLTAKQKYLLGKRLDINKAGWREISGLPGISDEVAREVVEVRARIGGFRRPEDLRTVRGIKNKRLKKILPFLSELPNN